MSASNVGTSYTSFSYLDPATDYRAFDLADEIDRVPPYHIPLTDEEDARVTRLLEENILISLHEHLGVMPADVAESKAYTHEGRMATAFDGLRHAHWDAVLDNLMDGILNIESKCGWKWTEVIHDLGMRLCDIAHQDFVFHATTVDDIGRAHAEGRIAWIASMEGCAMIENEVERIEILYGLGVRALGITYSESNALGSGLKEPGDGGLTVFGRRAVERMNKVGMLIDCAHCGDQTTLDVIEASEKPIVLSHIGARALWDSNRLAPDAVIEACAAKGGVIGIEAAPHTTLSPDHPTHTLDSVMDHFEYVKKLVGIDHVGFGPDTIFGDHVGLHNVYAANLSLKEATGGQSFGRVAYVEGLENPTEGSKTILRWLVKHGYSDEDIAKAMGGNALRVMTAAWGD
jgi:membrane dipeptidase